MGSVCSSVLEKFEWRYDRFVDQRAHGSCDHSDMHRGGQDIHDYAWKVLDQSGHLGFLSVSHRVPTCLSCFLCVDFWHYRIDLLQLRWRDTSPDALSDFRS